MIVCYLVVHHAKARCVKVRLRLVRLGYTRGPGKSLPVTTHAR
jgi:hypothetical protein